MAKNILFDFDNMAKGAKVAARQFTRAGANVVQTDAGTAVKRTSGVSYRELALTFADSQAVALRIKSTGDIWQVLINGKIVPIKSQDDHQAAVGEIVKALDAGRTKFQALLAKAKAKLPPTIRTAAPKLEAVLVEKRDGLKVAIQAVRDEIATLREPAAA